MSRNPVIRSIIGSVRVDDWADVYVGTCSSITRCEPLVQANWGPAVSFDEAVLVDCCDYVYVAAWSNKAGHNGLAAEISGATPVSTGDPGWEVFATGHPYSQSGAMYDADIRPSVYDINLELARACKQGWSTPAVYPPGATGMPPTQVNGNWIWHDSQNDTRLGPPPPPFLGFDHEELLIFRLPIRLLYPDACDDPCPDCRCGCDDGCNGCVEDADEKREGLLSRADLAFTDVEAQNNPTSGTRPFGGDCRAAMADVVALPYLYTSWGKSAGDQIENHDTEVLYVTVRNPFSDLEFRGFRVSSVRLSPTPPLSDHARIVPDCFIDYGCIPPCSSVTSEFALITRNRGEYVGPVELHVDYCFDDLVLTKGPSRGTAVFPLTIVDDD